MSRDQREELLNQATRRILVADNYDPHFATLEQRVLVEDRLFLARFDALCRYVGINPATFLPVNLPRWRNNVRGVEYSEICRGEYLTVEPARPGVTLIAYRDSLGQVYMRMASEMEDGRYERLAPPPRL